MEKLEMFTKEDLKVLNVSCEEEAMTTLGDPDNMFDPFVKEWVKSFGKMIMKISALEGASPEHCVASAMLAGMAMGARIQEHRGAAGQTVFKLIMDEEKS
jgi:hypothetical protein